MADDAFAATLDPRQAPSGDALARQPTDPLDADYRQTIGDIRQSMQRQQETAAARERTLAPLRQEQMQMLRRPLPQPPQQQQAPPVPSGRNEPGADEAWLMAASVLGAIAGGLTRNHTTNALAAATGAMEGYHEGNRQRFDQEMKRWNAENSKILETNKAANDRYLQILQSNKLALEQKSQEIQLAAAQYDDRAAMQLAQTKNFETLGRLIEQRMSHQQQMQMQTQRLQEQAQHWRAQEAAANQRNDRLVDAFRERNDPNAIAQRAAAAAEPKALSTTLSKLTQQKAAISQYENTALRNMDYLIQLADKVDKTGVPALERWLRFGERAIGENDVRAFVTQLEVVKPEIARILSNPNLTGALTNYARQEIEHFMDQGMSAKNVRTVVNVLKRDFINRRQSLDDEIADVQKSLRGFAPGGGPRPAAGGEAPPSSSPAPAGPPAMGGDMPIPPPPGGDGWQEMAPGIRFREIRP